MKKKIKKGSELDAFNKAKEDLLNEFGIDAVYKTTEDKMPGYFDDRKSSKCDDRNYEEGDGALEQSFKKMIKKLFKIK